MDIVAQVTASIAGKLNDMVPDAGTAEDDEAGQEPDAADQSGAAAVNDQSNGNSNGNNGKGHGSGNNGNHGNGNSGNGNGSQPDPVDPDSGEPEEPDVTKPGNNGNGNSSGNNGQGNGNNASNGDGNGNVKDPSTVVKHFVVDYNTETFEPLMEHEVNGLDYKYVYGNDRQIGRAHV